MRFGKIIWTDDNLPSETRKDLKWWLQEAEDPAAAILMVTDMHLNDLGELGPLMANHLNHEDDYIRELTVGCLIGRLFQTQYAAKAFKWQKKIHMKE